MWGVDKLGNYTQINGEHWIKLSPESDSIRFIANFQEFICAYVVGDFNDWEKSEDYKLTWKMDYNDKSIKLMKDVIFKSGLSAGSYRYSYVLVDDEGNELFLKNRNNEEPIIFKWEVLKKDLEIKASDNSIYLDTELELIALKNAVFAEIELADVTWEFEPKIDGISIEDGILKIDESVKNIRSLTIKCNEKEGNLLASREFDVIPKKRKGNLVHFIKSDEEYSGEGYAWDLWTYSNSGNASPIQLSEWSEFGKVAEVTHEHVIVRRKAWGFGWNNDWSEQTYSFEVPRNAGNSYIVYGETEIFTTLKDVIKKTIPRINHAIMDERDKITAYLSNEPLIGTEFDIYVNGVKQDNINTIVKDKKRKVIFTNLPLDILTNDLVEVRASNMFLPVKVTMRNYLDTFYYKGNDMGVVFKEDEISLRLWAPTASKVEVLIYGNWDIERSEPDKIYNLSEDYPTGTSYITINRRENENKYYLYRLYFKEIDRNGKEYVKITYAVDPYAVGVSVNGYKGVLLDLNSEKCKPSVWEQDIRPVLKNKEDSILYEMHIRDFTIDKNSGIKDLYKGKYLGAIQQETTYKANGLEVSTGIDHLIELGITHVHILPFYDFSSVDERYCDEYNNRNWGYDPQNYNVPEGSYSIDPFSPFSRIKEARKMINGFHKNGIRVVMDMVYNHMSSTSNFDNIVPGYYFRTDKFGRFTNGSGCGNEIATERPMVSKFILDSVLHWIKNYHIDGLRFDLMELMDFDTMKKIVNEARKIDPSVIVYGEPWKGGDSPLKNATYRGRQKFEEFSIFNDIFRDVVRGGNAPSSGFVNGDQHSPFVGWNIMEGLKGCVNGLTGNPGESINYVDAHDNYTLWDQIEKSQNIFLVNGQYRANITKDVFENNLVKQNVLAMAIMLTAQGIPFIQGGTEILRTKNGDHNSYKSSDVINAIAWEDKCKFKQVFDYYKGLIKLRREHAAFRMRSGVDVKNNLHIKFAQADEKSGVIISHLANNANGDEWKNIIIIYNGTTIDGYDVNSSIPNTNGNKFNIVVNDEKSGIDIIQIVEKDKIPLVRAHSMMVLYN